MHFFLLAFGVDLGVVELAHFDALLMLPLLAVMIFDLSLDHVVEGEDVPGVVSFRLDHALCTSLNRCLGEVLGLIIKGAIVQAGGASCIAGALQSEPTVVDHWPMEDWGKSRLFLHSYVSCLTVRVASIVKCRATRLQRLQPVLSLVDAVQIALDKIWIEADSVAVAFTGLW